MTCAHRCNLSTILIGSVFLFACAPESSNAVELLEPQPASDAFYRTWSDGKAELSGYRVTTPRYGQLREGTAVLIYVTEEMNKRTLIKDDTGTVPPGDKEVVLKLNNMLDFRTGIYPYKVMTSVFSPVGSSGRERFAPAKISFSAQEWCGQVFHMLKPTVDAFDSEIRSYFSSEGDADEHRSTPAFTLYEDALFIQLRELDGPFNGGKDWSGHLVPAVWSTRKRHVDVDAVPATISRAAGDRSGIAATLFTLRYDDFERTFFVETGGSRRLLGWTSSDGENAEILKTARLPYWQLNGNGAESYLSEIGLEASGSTALPQ
jgi:hypothetical protein